MKEYVKLAEQPRKHKEVCTIYLGKWKLEEVGKPGGELCFESWNQLLCFESWWKNIESWWKNNQVVCLESWRSGKTLKAVEKTTMFYVWKAGEAGQH